MEKTLTEICDYLNNYFQTEKRTGSFTIENGSITASFLKAGQYFRIVGSIFNDGVHKYPATDMTDETFDGAIWPMAVPQTVVDLAVDITAWLEKYGQVNSEAMSPFASESFGNYSYSKGTATAGSGSPNSWQSVFASRLNKWRRLPNV